MTNRDYQQPPKDLINIFNNNVKFISIATGENIDTRRIDKAMEMLNLKYNNKFSFEKMSNELNVEIIANILAEYVSQ